MKNNYLSLKKYRYHTIYPMYLNLSGATVKQLKNICPDSIRWILNWRQMDPGLIRDDKHTQARLSWVKTQSRFIDHHGWEAWLRSERATGYINSNNRNINQTK